MSCWLPWQNRVYKVFSKVQPCRRYQNTLHDTPNTHTKTEEMKRYPRCTTKTREAKCPQPPSSLRVPLLCCIITKSVPINQLEKKTARGSVGKGKRGTTNLAKHLLSPSCWGTAEVGKLALRNPEVPIYQPEVSAGKVGKRKVSGVSLGYESSFCHSHTEDKAKTTFKEKLHGIPTLCHIL